MRVCTVLRAQLLCVCVATCVSRAMHATLGVLAAIAAQPAHRAPMMLPQISFYYSHRLLHSTLLYKRVHKVGLVDPSTRCPPAPRTCVGRATVADGPDPVPPPPHAPPPQVHHEFKQPIALAAGYAHPLEVLIGNTAPLFLHPVITGAPLSVALLWLCIATISTQTHHSGYRMPWNLGAQPDFHDFHHCPEGSSQRRRERVTLCSHVCAARFSV